MPRAADTARSLAESAVDCRRRAGTAVDRNSVPNTVSPRFAEIIDVTEEVCRNHLTEEYATVIGELTATPARKRPSPLLRGHSRTWACGITCIVLSVNLSFDPARGADLCACFGVSQTAGAAKSRQITCLFDIAPFDPRWTLRSRLAENPLVCMLSVNGVIADFRTMPRELQEQAHDLGLIPFVPAECGRMDGAS